MYIGIRWSVWLALLIIFIYLVNIVPKHSPQGRNALENVRLVERAAAGKQIVTFPKHRKAGSAESLVDLSLEPLQLPEQLTKMDIDVLGLAYALDGP
jgi:hypothetical protein